jgi:hypothetical protein
MALLKSRVIETKFQSPCTLFIPQISNTRCNIRELLPSAETGVQPMKLLRCPRVPASILRCLLVLMLAAATFCMQALITSSAALAQPQPESSLPVQPSQAPRRSRPVQQGTQISINGRTFSFPWVQWQATGATIRTGISDAGLMQAIGVELLNSTDVAQQPIQWFSQPTRTPLNLATRLIDSFRYLDITDLARQMGWQVQANGATLQITFPIARIQAVRQGKQPWGDRLVIELDRPATWQVDQQRQEFVLNLDAQIDPALVQNFKPVISQPVQSLKLEPATNQTRLRLGIPLSLRPRVWSLPEPNRLVVDIRPDSLVDRAIAWAPGLRWRSQILNLGTTRIPTVWLEINLRQTGLRLLSILPNPTGLAGIASLLQTARQTGVAAAINGGFFNRNNQFPLGAIRRDGRWLSGPILGRGAIAWNTTGETAMGRLTLQETIITPSGQRLPLTHLNSAYVQTGIARYTSEWGATYVPFADNEILVTVQNNQVVSQQPVATAAGATPVRIPQNGYLLVVRSNQTAATQLSPGATLRLETTVTPAEFNRYPQIIAAGPLLVQNRQLVLDATAEKFSDAFARELASRSAIGRSSDGTLLLVAVHNRLDGNGVSLSEIAQLMQQLGAIDALNLDGGSSTTLYLGGQILDRPARTAARVHNGIGVSLLSNP